MLVTDAQTAALRAFLTHDPTGMTQLAAELGNAGMPGYQSLADAALSVAARRHFAPRYTGADLIRYVASVRTARLNDGDDYDFDPVAGELVLRQALGHDGGPSPDPVERFRAVLALLDALAENEQDTDELITEARVLLDQG
jgi:hypothetical protein